MEAVESGSESEERGDRGLSWRVIACPVRAEHASSLVQSPWLPGSLAEDGKIMEVGEEISLLPLGIVTRACLSLRKLGVNQEGVLTGQQVGVAGEAPVEILQRLEG